MVTQDIQCKIRDLDPVDDLDFPPQSDISDHDNLTNIFLI